MSATIKARIHTLLQEARLDEAKKLCQSLCKKNNDDAEAWFLLGSIYGHERDFKNAIESLHKSVSIENGRAITHHNLGLAYLHSGNPAMAKESLATALRIDPGSVTTRLELANAMQADGSPADAIPLYQSVLQQNPGAIPVLTNLALAYVASQNPDKAVPVYRKIIELQGDSAEVLFMLGNAYRQTGQLDDAESVYRRVLKINPLLGGVLNNLGLTLSDLARHKEAEACFRSSMQAEPQQSDAYINLASCLQDQRRTHEALEVLRTALELYPNKPELHWDISLVLLKLGQFTDGWKEYEWRMTGSSQPYRNVRLPAWKGENLAGKSLLVIAEQGIGDEIMFASCYQDLQECAAHVVIDCEPRLAPLFKRSFIKSEIRAGKQTDDLSPASLAGIDVYIHAGSTPGLLQANRHVFRKHNGYLTADTDAMEKWSNRYRALGSNINVGLSWKGGHATKQAKRSASINHWLPVLKQPGINFINLQYGDCQGDIDIARKLSAATIHHWNDSDPLTDMDDFAAQISALDLVISVDNSTAHLAGALGVKTWLLQPYNTDWRWLEHAADSYWYPALEQFHPSSPGNWESILVVIAERLSKYPASR